MSVPPRRLWLWKNGDHFWAFDNEYPCYDLGGDPKTLGEPVGWAVLKDSSTREGTTPTRSQLQRLLDRLLTAQTHFATEWNKGLAASEPRMNEAEEHREAAMKELLDFVCGENS